MPKKTLIFLLVIALLATGLLTACGTTTVTETKTSTVASTVTTTVGASPTATTTKTTGIIETIPATTTKPVNRPASWDEFGKPVYGGTFNMRAYPGLDQMFYDPYLQSGFGGYSAFSLAYDNPFYLNWYVDRAVNPLKTTEENNLSLAMGALVDTWEMLDPSTVKCHIRDGVHFWNRPPANGRELVAGDIVAHYDRLRGLDGGTPNASFASAFSLIDSITAPDDDTLIYKLKQANFTAYCQVFREEAASSKIEYPLGRNVTKAADMIGTGPYWVKEEVPGSSITFERNPDYWAFDERFPENRLPYFDEVTVTQILDNTTAITALRTGKLDVLGSLDWRQADTLTKSNPELKQRYSTTMGYGIRLRVDQAPFNDINIRKALQMAIDLPLLAETHYGGTVDPTPFGIGSPNYEGWYTPFNEWPQELQYEYGYHPSDATAILMDAGYTLGNPLRFEATAESNADLDQLQILQQMFAAVGFKMDIKTIMPGGMFPAVGMKQYQTLYFYTTGLAFPKGVSIVWFSPTQATLRTTQLTTAQAADMEAIINKFMLSPTLEEARLNFLATEQYCLAQHWDILTVCPRNYTFWSPNFMGYTGEYTNLNLSNWVAKVWKK